MDRNLHFMAATLVVWMGIAGPAGGCPAFATEADPPDAAGEEASAQKEEGASGGKDEPEEEASKKQAPPNEEAAEDEKGKPEEAPAKGPAPKELTIEDLRRMLEQQAKAVEQQRKQIEEQEKQIQSQREALETQQQVLTAMQTRLDQLATDKGQGMTDSEVALRERLEKLESKVAENPEDPITAGEVPGSIRIPGTNAAYKLGGFVKVSAITSFQPLGSSDRFIVASIPVGDEAAGEGSRVALTADQSRLNFDLRQTTTKGNLRGYVEGDFAGTDEFFRLRHAYGQFRQLLAGKTWSTFMDSNAVPEEIDFEGLTGRLLVRQAQFRYFPNFGKNWNLAIGLEDPQPDLTGGVGVSQIPDLTTRVRKSKGRGHLQVAILLRQLRGQATTNPEVTDGAFGWGASFSGRVDARGSSPDNFMFQINVGDGFGRYINDLQAEGGQDAVFNPASGDLETLPAVGAYASYQHWWNATMRSTVVVTGTYVDNLDFQPDDAYHRAQRASANFLWSPIPRFDLGLEYIWGRRTDNDGSSGWATQLQVGMIYKF